ncbi:YybH family protein [Spongiimicrobium sp. 2-473A-2-J]|uniref:YybH family protein n=1 Tax=Eudoraea algarum TaxID=3417568 RepID=UPI003D36CCBA
MKTDPTKWIATLLLLLTVLSCKERIVQAGEPPMGEDEIQIRQLHTDYVNGWIDNNEGQIMGLLEENARIQPNSLMPIEGKQQINAFWFPKDGSSTKINTFETEILNFQLLDTLAITTHSSLLDWTYKKDTLQFGRVQKGVNTTVYRKQGDGSWKIWRSMWTDIDIKNK